MAPNDDQQAQGGKRQWNLGKPTRGAEKPAPEKLATPPPVAEKAPPPAPPEEKEDEFESLPDEAMITPSTDSETSHSEVVIMGRPVPPPKNLRDLLSHPFTLIGLGLGICVFLLWLVLGGKSVSEKNTVSLIDPANPGEATILYLAPREEIGGDKVKPILYSETQPERDGRLILAMGEVFMGVAEQLTTPGKKNDAFYLESKAIFSIRPDATANELDRWNAEIQIQEVAQDVIYIGQHVLEQTKASNIPPPDLQRIGYRLREEGLSILERNLVSTESRDLIPNIVGSSKQLEDIQINTPDAEVTTMLSALLPSEILYYVDSARRRHFN